MGVITTFITTRCPPCRYFLPLLTRDFLCHPLCVWQDFKTINTTSSPQNNGTFFRRQYLSKKTGGIFQLFQKMIPLLEEILHQLIGGLSHYSQGFIHSRWLAGFLNHRQSLPFFLTNRTRNKNPFAKHRTSKTPWWTSAWQPMGPMNGPWNFNVSNLAVFLATNPPNRLY